MKYIKWLGGGLGWALGGPIGAIIGFVIGSAFDGTNNKVRTLQGKIRYKHLNVNNIVLFFR